MLMACIRKLAVKMLLNYMADWIELPALVAECSFQDLIWISGFWN